MYAPQDAKGVEEQVASTVTLFGPITAAMILGIHLHRGMITRDDALCIFDRHLIHSVSDWDERHRLLTIVASHLPYGQWEVVTEEGEPTRLKTYFYTEEFEALAITEGNRVIGIKRHSVKRIPFVLEYIFDEIRAYRGES